ncbi:MAG: hypothetical protein H7296_03405, partial [Bacteroidia bacterium]|nr:hypothetical protein [Bacteroidia bacterium]
MIKLKYKFNYVCILFIFFLFAFSLTAQQKKVNRLTGILANYRGNDTVKVAMLCELATAYKTIHPDT